MIDENEDSKKRGHNDRLLGLEADSDKNSSIINNQKTLNDENETKTSLIASNTGNQKYSIISKQRFFSVYLSFNGKLKLNSISICCRAK